MAGRSRSKNGVAWLAYVAAVPDTRSVATFDQGFLIVARNDAPPAGV
jgi:hypothetical protein